jgi:rhamnose utilization protein RhaD (predicted bifunctional aldolase and dehydrogenase)
MLHLLSIDGWIEELDNLYHDMSVLYVEYKKPGLELSNRILNLYTNESIIFLQNHGIIICSNNIDEIYSTIDTLIKKYDEKYSTQVPSTNIFFMKHLYMLLPDKLIKSSFLNNITNDRYFYKLSPDILLYLGERPIILESTEQNIDDEIKKNINVKIIIYEGLIYCISNSYSNLKSLEEMIHTYYLVIKCNNNSNLFHEISNEESLVLNNWDKEKLRLQ